MICYISIGSNLGNSRSLLEEALSRLSRTEGISLLDRSSVYKTPPWGKTDQPYFLNAAAKLSVSISPLDLLSVTQSIEQELGRVRHEHWGPRTIDIDLLMTDEYTCDTDILKLPHPYMTKRAFVLVPLLEIEDIIIDQHSARWHLKQLPADEVQSIVKL